MPRRTFRRAIKGQLYAIEWPEWHVECAHDECDCSALVAALGEAITLKEAEKKTSKADGLDGWKRIGGLWFCPDHAAVEE